MSPERAPARFQEVDPAYLLQRICVRPPYFALRGIQYAEGVLEASASAELPAGREVGPMRSAELSRHAAIAGVCVVALGQHDHDRRYYLAKQAWYEGFESDAPHGAPIALCARLLQLSKRGARAVIAATADGVPVAKLEVQYSVLTAPAFERLFRAHRQVTPEQRSLGTLPLGTTTRVGNTLHSAIGPIHIGACSGHFDSYPATPIAVLMGELIELAGDALGEGTLRYRVARGRVEAQDLCWAGEIAQLAATPIAAATPTNNEELTIACSAHAGDRPAATLTITLVRMPA